MPSGKALAKKCHRFMVEMPSKLLKFNLRKSEVPFVDWQKLECHSWPT